MLKQTVKECGILIMHQIKSGFFIKRQIKSLIRLTFVLLTKPKMYISLFKNVN